MKWLYGILCLFFLILFHEIGHFFACKIFGVKVESFSIGFGPILIHKIFKGTDFRLSLIPLGGYCGIKGDNEFREAVENDLPQMNSSSDSLYGIHALKRALIGFGGPFFNFIFAVVAYSLINGIGYSYYTFSNEIILIDDVYENVASSARSAGLLSGDKIIKIQNKKIENFSDIVSEISSRPQETVDILVIRNQQEMLFKTFIEMDKASGTGKIGITANTETITKVDSPKYSFFQSIYHGIKETFDSIYLTLKSFSFLFKGADIKNSIGGPARITDMLGTTIKESFSNSIKTGFINLLNLTAIISISLFIMNLLPVPVLDGGLIIFSIFEFITRKKIRPKIQYYVQYVGLFFLLLLFIIGTVSDISYFINRG